MAREVEAKLVLSAQDRTRKAFESIERRLKGIDRQTTKATRMQAQAARIEQATVRATSSAYATTARIAAPLLAAGGLAQGARTLASYEDAMVGIAKKAGLTESQMMKVGDEARALATSGELAVPLQEIMAAYERGAAAGLPLDQLEEFARLSAMAADAFEMSATDVGNAAAGFRVTLGIPISEMERYFDLINGLADSGIADESDLINFLDRAGASLKLFGLSAEQAAAYGASLANIKMAPEVAANALSTLTGKLLSPGSETAQIALRNIVGDVDAFQKLLKQDANKALLTFLKSVGQLDKFKATELLGGLVGAGFDDEILRLASAYDEVQRNLEYAASQDWFGSLSKSYDLKLKSLSSQWQLFKNQIEETVIDVGLMGLPVLKEGLDYSRERVQEIGLGLEQFRAKIDLTEFENAKVAVSELAESVSSLLSLSGDGNSQIEKLFNRLATAANTVSGAINVGHDFAEKLGLVEKDSETPALEADRLQGLWDAYTEWNPVVRRGANMIDHYWNGGQGQREREARVAGQPLPATRAENLADEVSELNARIVDLVERGGDPAMIARLQEIAAMKSFGIGALPSATPTRSGSLVDDRVSAAFDDASRGGRLEAIPEDLNASTDALRQAMQEGGATILEAGPQSGQGFADAASAGIAATATQSGTAFGQAAAAAFNANLRIPLPGGGSAPSRPRADLGDSSVGAGELSR